jgi:hypothetical protein
VLNREYEALLPRIPYYGDLLPVDEERPGKTMADPVTLPRADKGGFSDAS